MALTERKLTPIHIGTCTIYIGTTDYDEALPETIAGAKEWCEAADVLGYLNDGAEGTYEAEFYTAKDDQRIQSRTKLVEESFKVSANLENYSGDTIAKLIPTGVSTYNAETGDRVTTIGGAQNDDGTVWTFCLYQEDAEYGDVAIFVRGKNTSGFTITEKNGSESTPEIGIEAQSLNSKGHIMHMIEHTGVDTTNG